LQLTREISIHEILDTNLQSDNTQTIVYILILLVYCCDTRLYIFKCALRYSPNGKFRTYNISIIAIS